MATIALASPATTLAADSAEAAARVSPCATSAMPSNSALRPRIVETEAQSLSRLYFLPVPLAAVDAVPTGLVVPLSAEAIERMDADELQMQIAATEKLIAALTAQMPQAPAYLTSDCRE